MHRNPNLSIQFYWDGNKNIYSSSKCYICLQWGTSVAAKYSTVVINRLQCIVMAWMDFRPRLECHFVAWNEFIPLIWDVGGGIKYVGVAHILSLCWTGAYQRMSSNLCVWCIYFFWNQILNTVDSFNKYTVDVSIAFYSFTFTPRALRVACQHMSSSSGLRLEQDVKKLKADLQASRQVEQDLRSQIGSLGSAERSIRTELGQLRQENELLQNKWVMLQVCL